MSRRLSWALALLLALMPAAAHAQSGQSSGASNEVPPPTKSMEIKSNAPQAPLSSYARGGDYTVAAGPGNPDVPVSPNAVPEKRMSGGEALNKTYEATDTTVDALSEFAPDKNNSQLTKTTNARNAATNVLTTFNVVTSGTEKIKKGDYAGAAQDVAEAAGAEIVNQCVDRAFDAAVAAACAPTLAASPAAYAACVAAAKIAKYCIETALDTDVGESAVKGAKTLWANQVQAFKQQQAAVQAANAVMSGGTAGCHPGHDEAAHPGGCHDYSR